jgi:hypothetical protein
MCPSPSKANSMGTSDYSLDGGIVNLVADADSVAAVRAGKSQAPDDDVVVPL